MAVVLVMSLRPMPQGLPDISGIDKLYHFFAYMFMSILMILALRDEAGKTGRVGMWAAVALVSAFGVMVEVLQSFTTTRSADAIDAVVNGMGAVAGAFVSRAFVRLTGGMRG